MSGIGIYRQHVCEEHNVPSDRPCTGCVQDALAKSKANEAKLRELVDGLDGCAKRLVTLADWFDLKNPEDKNPEIQRDLRGWASTIRELENAKRVLEETKP